MTALVAQVLYKCPQSHANAKMIITRLHWDLGSCDVSASPRKVGEFVSLVGAAVLEYEILRKDFAAHLKSSRMSKQHPNQVSKFCLYPMHAFATIVLCYHSIPYSSGSYCRRQNLEFIQPH